MLAINQKEHEVLQILAHELERHGHPVTAPSIASKMIPKTNSKAAKLCLDHLVKARLVTSNFDNPRYAGYEITREGLTSLGVMASSPTTDALPKHATGVDERSSQIGMDHTGKPLLARVFRWVRGWGKPEVLAIILAAIITAIAALYAGGKI
ncbi:hypothetical protein [Flavisphingopyxis soli]|uniref:hypothetical protein n=1 Tax=Flavisphingopyxis soli TaxID=2601267 RepID=UPI0011BD9019|nr:hypothetical protein [Sphingorhabdus soli]